jgi:hypothetical protein
MLKSERREEGQLILGGLKARWWAMRYLEQYLCQCNREDCNCITINRYLIEADLALDEVTPPGALEVISSGQRCPIHNAQSGGHHNSGHLYGRAEDRYVGTITLADAYIILEDLGAYTGIGLYIGKDHKPFAHMEVGTKPRRWGRIDGNYIGGMRGIESVIAEEERRSSE